MIPWMVACAVAGPTTLPMATVPTPAAGQQVAVFAGGCFWCMESDFDGLTGVISTTSGFAGGKTEHPTYEQVGAHGTGHAEAVYVVFDPKVVPYDKLVDYFWRHVDPTDAGGQFCDRGDSYRTAIFPVDPAQQAAAEASKAALTASGWLGKPVVTEIVPNQRFWPAEAYHQDFHHVNPGRYLPYRKGCGRDARVAEVWKNAPPPK
ncbi:MAG: peptide-methionine (S)-S-oxide reductase MsrA [Myxococcota bacterium]